MSARCFSSASDSSRSEIVFAALSTCVVVKKTHWRWDACWYLHVSAVENLFRWIRSRLVESGSAAPKEHTPKILTSLTWSQNPKIFLSGNYWDQSWETNDNDCDHIFKFSGTGLDSSHVWMKQQVNTDLIPFLNGFKKNIHVCNQSSRFPRGLKQATG